VNAERQPESTVAEVNSILCAAVRSDAKRRDERARERRERERGRRETKRETMRQSDPLLIQSDVHMLSANSREERAEKKEVQQKR